MIALVYKVGKHKEAKLGNCVVANQSRSHLTVKLCLPPFPAGDYTNAIHPTSIENNTSNGLIMAQPKSDHIGNGQQQCIDLRLKRKPVTVSRLRSLMQIRDESLCWRPPPMQMVPCYRS